MKLGTTSVKFISYLLILNTVFFSLACLFFLTCIWRPEKNDVIKSVNEQINIACIVCGENYFSMFSTLLKSALLFQKTSKLHFIVFSEASLKNRVSRTLEEWSLFLNDAFTYEIRDVVHTEMTVGYFKCTMDRLYLPEFLPDLDKVLYVDLDTVFLKDLTDIWRQFHQMNSSQLCGVAWNNPTIETSIYAKLQHVPFYGLGLNGGILLMDLKKMREFEWIKHAEAAIKKYNKTLYGLDQDVINVIFHDNPDKIYVLPCRFNLQSCHFNSIDGICKDAVINAPTILHGCGYIFQVERDNSFPYIAIYRVQEAFKKYELGTDLMENLLKPMKMKLANATKNNSTDIMRLYLDDENIIRLLG